MDYNGQLPATVPSLKLFKQSSDQATDELLQFHERSSLQRIKFVVRFEVFTAVTMKTGVFWDVTLCGPCKNRRFGGT
jgi:hypothetical protein